MVSHPETGSDSPIGSDRDRGRDKKHRVIKKVVAYKYIPHHIHTIIFERVTFCEQKS